MTFFSYWATGLVIAAYLGLVILSLVWMGLWVKDRVDEARHWMLMRSVAKRVPPARVVKR